MVCEIVEAVLGHCDRMLAMLAGGRSLFGASVLASDGAGREGVPFKLTTTTGESPWLPDGERASGEPDARARFYVSEYRVRVLSEDPIPEDLGLAGVLREADTGSYVAVEEQLNVVVLSPERCAQLLSAFGSSPVFFGLEEPPHATGR